MTSAGTVRRVAAGSLPGRPALLLFQLLRFPIALIPHQLAAWISARISSKRLDAFLRLEALPEPPGETWWPGAPGVVIADGGFEWSRGTPVLHDLTLTLPRGGLTLIVGAVGSGKSSILP